MTSFLFQQSTIPMEGEEGEEEEEESDERLEKVTVGWLKTM